MGGAISPPAKHLTSHWDALERASRLGPVVDVACGRGRNALAVAARGIPVLGLDRDPDHLRTLQERARAERCRVQPVRCDLEGGGGLPLRPGRCGAVLVFRYLFRPLAAELSAALAPGGLLLYETFTIHQRDLGYGPKNSDFLLRDGELAGLFPDLELLSVWEGVAEEGRPAAVARLAARRPVVP